MVPTKISFGGLRVAEHKARHNDHVQDSVKVAALKRMMTAKMAERYIEGPNTYPELRSRVAADVGEKMIQQESRARGHWRS